MDTIQKIIKILNEKNITGAKMSRDLGFSNSSFSQWQNGRSKISVDNLAKIAEYLNCSADYLLGKTDNPNPLEIPPELNKIQVAFSGMEDEGLEQEDIDMLVDIVNRMKEKNQRLGK